jgi:hypothetical protein
MPAGSFTKEWMAAPGFNKKNIEEWKSRFILQSKPAYGIAFCSFFEATRGQEPFLAFSI